MFAVPLFRWTMSYFALATLAFMASESAMALGWGYPAIAISAPATLAVAHLLLVGWLSLLLAGALQQFVPVLVARPLRFPALGLPTLILLATGCATLVGGLASLGHPHAAFCLDIAMAALGGAFTLLAVNLGATLQTARPWGLPARYVAFGLGAIVLTATLGITLGSVLAGQNRSIYATRLLAHGVPIHAISGIGGWLSLTAIGVSYRLLSMFMLAPESEHRRSQWACLLAGLALLLAVAGGALAIELDQPIGRILAVAAIPGAVSVVVYLFDIQALYQLRQRRHLELNARMSGIALGFLLAGILLLAAAALLADHQRLLIAAVYALLFGWLSGLGLAQLYKIVAFLTWLETIGPCLGRGPTPRVQDLVVEEYARPWFLLYFAAVALSTALLIAGTAQLFRVTAGLQLLATLGIVIQLVQTRRLRLLKSGGDGTSRPSFLYVRTGTTAI